MVTLTAYTFCGVSLLTLTAINVDRLLSLQLGLRYRQVATVEKTYIAIIAFWIVSVVGVPASLLTLTAISVDRPLALLLGLRHRQVVTVEKTYIAIIAFCVVSVVGVPASTAI